MTKVIMFSQAITTTFRNAVQAVFNKEVNRIGTFRRGWPTYNVTDAVSPSSQKRGIHISDAGLGATNRRTVDHFIRHQISSDDRALATRELFKAPQTGYREEARVAYAGAFEQYRGYKPKFDDIVSPWQDLGFTESSSLRDPDVPYAKYYRDAVNTAFNRGGKVHFYLGGINARLYIEGIVLVEHESQKRFADYANTVSLPTMVNEAREAEAHKKVGPPPITSIELYDSSMGTFKNTGEKYHYYSQNDVLLDIKKLQRLQEVAFAAARTMNNIDLLLESGEVTQEAEEAIEALQTYMSTGELRT